MDRLVTMMLAVSLTLMAASAPGQDRSAPTSVGTLPAEPAPALYVDAVTDAARAFLALLDEDQRGTVLAPFDSSERVTGRETDRTPAFCAVLAWCVGWGLPQCSLTYTQRKALARLLAAALSDSGYQTVRAVLNSHREIGELEAIGNADFIGEVARKCDALEVDSVFDIPERCRPDGKPAPDYVVVGGAAPVGSGGAYKMDWQWPNGPPGFKVRYQQFCDHNIAFFGEPGSERWAFRFEGHHLTVNLTFERGADGGGYRVYATPLFLGSFPLVVPPSPQPDNLERQLTWTASQELLLETVDHARGFVAALPAAIRQQGFVGDQRLKQAPPLKSVHFPNWLLTSTLPDPASMPLPHQPATFSGEDLDENAKWHLRLLFRRFFDTMHPVVADRYEAELDGAIAGTSQGTVLWAGDPPEMPDGSLFLYIAMGTLLIELNADNQWSTAHRATPSTNHAHGMLRDLSYRWDYDASVRPNADHQPTGAPAGTPGSQ